MSERLLKRGLAAVLIASAVACGGYCAYHGVDFTAVVLDLYCWVGDAVLGPPPPERVPPPVHP